MNEMELLPLGGMGDDAIVEKVTTLHCGGIDSDGFASDCVYE